ncbi:MAG: hypothetical protein V1708_05335 [Candidatus Micrarchaeota archaeon]
MPFILALTLSGVVLRDSHHALLDYEGGIIVNASVKPFGRLTAGACLRPIA